MFESSTLLNNVTIWKFDFKRGFQNLKTRSKGRRPFEFTNVRIVDVIEQHNDSEMSGFPNVLPEVRVGARLKFSNVRIVDVIEQRNDSGSSVLKRFEKITGSKGRRPFEVLERLNRRRY